MEIHAILTETLAGFLPGRAKDLSASPYMPRSNHLFSRLFSQNIVRGRVQNAEFLGM